jgi:hypothetical protein
MAWHLNTACASRARSLAKSGHTTDASWDESALPRDKAHSDHFLATNDDYSADEASHFGYPVVTPDGSLSLHALTNAASRASANGAAEISKEASAIHEEAKPAKKEMSCWLLLSQTKGEWKAETNPPSNCPKEILGRPCEYAWKDILHIGEWTHPVQKWSVNVDRNKLLSFCTKGNDMLADGIEIPINCDHDGGAREVVGYVKRFRIEGDTLWTFCQLIGKDAGDLAARNFTSPGIDPDYTDSHEGDWGEVVVHVALTPSPVINNQSEFLKAASRTCPAGDVLLLSAGRKPEPTQRSQNMAAQLSDGEVGALRGCAHLSMDKVPDEKIGAHLNDWHGKHAQAVKDLCMSMGDMDCPADMCMSRATGYVKGIRDLHSRLMPKNMSMPSKPDEAVKAIVDRVEMLQKEAPKIDELKTAKENADRQIVELSRQIPKSPFATPEAEKDGIENAMVLFDNLMEGENAFPASIVAKLSRALVSRDGEHANQLTLSRTANPGGNYSLAKEIATILNEARGMSWKPKMGPQSGLQTMSRRVPGGVDPDIEQAEKAAQEFMAAGKAK